MRGNREARNDTDNDTFVQLAVRPMTTTVAVWDNAYAPPMIDSAGLARDEHAQQRLASL